jgi:hypothetical protein
MPILDYQEPTPEKITTDQKLAKSANTVFLLSLISILFCCIGGIISSIFAYQATKAIEVGDTAEGASKMQTAKTIMILSYIVGFLSFMGKLADTMN